MPIAEFVDVHRAYEAGVEVLAGVTFSVTPGETVGLLGRNGAGKTTLMRIAMGMLEPQRGSVRLFGLDPRRNPLAVKQRVGYVSEEQILPPFLRVEEVVQLHRDLFPSWDEALAVRLAERFRLPQRAKVKALSKGQARQVALLCAVSHRPELLLLDEPAGGLDPAARREFLETSIRLVNETGSTILFSSHYMSDVERLADRVVLLDGGRVRIDEPLDDLREAFSLALLPAAHDPDRLLALEGCLTARLRGDTLHAVFRRSAEDTPALLHRELGLDDVPCTALPLEEMFIELVGGA